MLLEDPVWPAASFVEAAFAGFDPFTDCPAFFVPLRLVRSVDLDDFDLDFAKVPLLREGIDEGLIWVALAGRRVTLRCIYSAALG